MKKIFTLIGLLVISLMSAQHITIKNIESRLITHQGVEFVGELKDKNSDIYCFSNWDNTAKIFVNKKSYLLSNINFNVTTNKFESRIRRGKMFIYKNTSIDSISINNLMFKKISNSFYQVLFEKENSLFLKKHDLKYKAGVVNRIDGEEGSPTISLKYRYAVKIDDLFKYFELNKRDILDLVNSDKEELINNFVKEKRLSYKKEKDVARIIEFMLQSSSLTS